MGVNYIKRRGTPTLQNTFNKVLCSIFSWQKDGNSVVSTRLLNEEYIPEAKNHIDKINLNEELGSLRVKNLNKLIIGHLNINSLRNKFELLAHQIKDNIDILMISETKLYESFRTSFSRMVSVVLISFIIIVTVVIFFYILGRMYHPNLYQ